MKANTYAGKTVLDPTNANALGTLKLGIDNGLSTTTDFTINNNGTSVMTFDLNGQNQTIASLATQAAGGSTTNSIVTNSGALKTLTVNGSTTTAYAGLLSGALNLTKDGSSSLTLSGANTYTGNTTVTAGTLVLAATTGELTFKIGASGETNSIGGSGTLTLNGAFRFDLTSAATSGSWNIINVGTLNETWGSAFNVASFTRQGGGTGAGIWEGSASGTAYEFDTSLGTLTAVPEPATWALLAGSLTVVMVLRRRRQG